MSLEYSKIYDIILGLATIMLAVVYRQILLIRANTCLDSGQLLIYQFHRGIIRLSLVFSLHELVTTF